MSMTSSVVGFNKAGPQSRLALFNQTCPFSQGSLFVLLLDTEEAMHG
jgi:hypothetical protein